MYHVLILATAFPTVIKHILKIFNSLKYNNFRYLDKIFFINDEKSIIERNEDVLPKSTKASEATLVFL